ncbi:MAG TPA: hypothetical protein VHC45_00480 [Gaiellaceae bacterium]|nr:hypothetical protein [Gaiellaceae bacterium]
MLRRRRTSRKLVRVARMLQELDACAHPSARPGRRPSSRVALGRAA